MSVFGLWEEIFEGLNDIFHILKRVFLFPTELKTMPNFAKTQRHQVTALEYNSIAVEMNVT